MSPRKAEPVGPWSMHPSLHDSVSRLLEDDNLAFDFHAVDEPQSSIEEYDTNVMGRFVCKNKRCSSDGWSSKKIAISIRLYPRHRSYAERVAYRLKKWSGIVMELPPYSGQSNGPHLSSLCEGCRSGHCSQ
ncbi:hypothetical protein LTR28_003306 [Elasticomyces elasticus]|nr:hypothetical protein LTR28_003306 [Elasticomyces elasticus]